MNLDDLKSSWKQRQAKLADDHFEEVLSQVLTRTSWFQETILRRDRIETFAGLFVFLFFGYFFVRHQQWPWVARLGLAIIMLGAVEIVAVLHWARRRGFQARLDVPLAEFCASEIARVERQIWLLRNVNWWYSGPILLGCCTFTLGLLNSFGLPSGWLAGALAVLYGFYFAVGWSIYRINQRSVRNELQPVRDELARIYESLRDDSSRVEGSGGE